jgi:DnaK suppressor protein
LHSFLGVTTRERDRIRRKLTLRLTEIYRSVHADVRNAMVRELFEQEEPRDEGDESLRTLLRDTRMRLAEVDAGRAQAIEAALARLTRGEYGVCADCGGAIERKRLQAVPWALRCVDCQEVFEFNAKDRSPSL